MCLSPEQMMVTMALRVVALRGGSYWVVVLQFQKNLYLVFFTGKGKVLRGNSGSPYCVMRQTLVRIVEFPNHHHCVHVTGQKWKGLLEVISAIPVLLDDTEFNLTHQLIQMTSSWAKLFSKV